MLCQHNRLSHATLDAVSRIRSQSRSQVFGGFFVHKTIIQTINQVNNCTGNGEDQKYGSDQQDQNQKDKQTVCLNTAVNNAGRGLGANGVGSGNLGNTGSGNLGNTGSGNLGQSDVPDNLLP